MTLLVFSSNKFLFALLYELFNGNWIANDLFNFEFEEAIPQESSRETGFAL